MIKVQNLSKEYITKSGIACLAVDDVSVSVSKGELLSITGESGSGKSTLLSMMGLLEIPTSGSIVLDGKPVQDMTNKELSLYRNQHMGFVFQNYYLEPTYTIYENIEVPMIIGGVKKSERKNRIHELAEQVHIEKLLKKKPGELSGGEQQRVSIARALANSPSILLADEPCGNLDSKNGQNIMTLFKKQAELGITILLVTHNLEHAKMTDRMIMLKDGKLVSDEKC